MASGRLPPAARHDDPDAVEGASYPNAVKGLAVTLVLLILVLGAGEPARRLGAALPLAGVVLVLAALVVVFVHFWALLRARTAVGGGIVRQGGVWRKQVLLADAVQLRLLRVRGLEWIITPRLVVRSRNFALTTFTTGDAAVLAAFERLADERRAPLAERP